MVVVSSCHIPKSAKLDHMIATKLRKSLCHHTVNLFFEQQILYSNFHLGKLLGLYNDTYIGSGHSIFLRNFGCCVISVIKECLRNYATGETTEKIPTAAVNEVIVILKEQGYDLKGIFREVRDVFINNANINKDRLKYFGK